MKSIYKMGPKQNIYVIYADQNKNLAHKLLRKLQLLENDYNVSLWHDLPIAPQQVWMPWDIKRLNEADTFLLFVSHAFMYSRFIEQDEFKMIIDRYKSGEATVFPILFDSCPWDIEFISDDYNFSFKELQVLPENREPISDWNGLDEALVHVIGHVKSHLGLLDSNEESEVSNDLIGKVNTNVPKKERIAHNLIQAVALQRAEEKQIAKKSETIERAVEPIVNRQFEEKGLAKKVETIKRGDGVEVKRKVREKRRADKVEATLRGDKVVRNLRVGDNPRAEKSEISQRIGEVKNIAEQTEANRIAFEKRKSRDENEVKKRMEQERQLKETVLAKKEDLKVKNAAEAKKIAEQAEIISVAFEKRKLRKEAEAKEKAKRKLRLEEAIEAKKITEEAEIKRIALEEQKIREVKEAKDSTERVLKSKEASEAKRISEEDEIKRIALEEQNKKEVKEAKECAERNLRLEEMTEAKRITKEAEIKGIALKEQKIKEVEEARKSALNEQKLKESEANRKSVAAKRRAERFAAIKRTLWEKMLQAIALTMKTSALLRKEAAALFQKIIALTKETRALIKKRVEMKRQAVEDVNRFEENSKPNKVKTILREQRDKRNNKVFIGLGILAIVIVGIGLFSSGPEKSFNATSKDEVTTIVEPTTASPASTAETANQVATPSKLIIGDLYSKGIIFKLDASGNSGKIAYLDNIGPMSWQKANALHEQLGEGWRLPTFEELRLMRKTIGQGATNKGEFSDGLYWSATPYDAHQARLLKFGNGNTSYHYNMAIESRKFLVRPVRDFSR